jgi:predicted GNAT family acetyltransferase
MTDGIDSDGHRGDGDDRQPSPNPDNTAVAEVSNNRDEHRYEIHEGTTLAGFAVYRYRGDTVVFTHTEIEMPFEGRGLASRLIRAALDDVRSQHKTVTPLCPFVAAYIRRHPDYANLIDPSYQPELQP